MMVMIIIVIAAYGNTSTTAYFNDRPACENALKVVAGGLKVLQPQPLFVITCQPVKGE